MYTLEHDIHHSFQRLITSNGGTRCEAGSCVDLPGHRLSKRLGSSVNICNELVCKYFGRKWQQARDRRKLAVLIPVYRVYFGETLKYLPVPCFSFNSCISDVFLNLLWTNAGRLTKLNPRKCSQTCLETSFSRFFWKTGLVCEQSPLKY